MAILSFLDNNHHLVLLAKEELLEKLTEKLPAALKDELLAAIEDPQGALDAFIEDKKQQLLAKIPEKYHFLLEPVGEFEDKNVDLVDYSKDAGAAQKLEFGVSAGAQIQLDLLTPEEFDRQAELGLGVDDVLFKLAFQGKLGVSANATAQTSVLKAGVSIAAGTEQQIAYYLMLDKRSRGITTLPVMKDCIVNPLDLDDVVAAMNASKLARFERSGLSSASIGLTLGLGKDVTAGMTNKVKASVGLDFKVDYKDKSNVSLVLEQLADESFVLELKKSRNTSTSSTLKLGVDIELVGFKNRLLEHVTKLLPEENGIKDILDKLDGYIEDIGKEELSGKLKAKLQAAWPQGQPAFAFLLGEEDSRKLSEQIQNELVERIQETVSTHVDVYSDAADVATVRVANAIADKLGLTSTYRQQFNTLVASSLESALKDLKSQLDTKVKDLVDAGGIDTLLRPWSFVGQEVNQAITAVSNQATDKLGKVKIALQSIYSRYTTFRQRVLNTIKEDFEEKIALSVVSHKERELDTTHALRVGFKTANADLRELYHNLWNSRIEDLSDILARLKQAGMEVTGEYVTAEKVTRDFKLTASLFGQKLSASVLFSSDVKVGIDTSGKLLVAKSAAAFTSARTWRGESQNIEARWSVDCLRNEVLDAPLDIKLTVTDKKFKTRDVVQFFTSLERFQVMRSGIGDSVQQALFPNHDNKPVKNATLAIHLVYRWQDWLRIVGADLKGKAVPGAWDAERIGKDFLAHVRLFAPDHYAHAVSLMSLRNYSDLYTYLLDFGKQGAAAHIWSKDPMSQGPGARSEQFYKGRRLARAVHALHEGVETLQATWHKVVKKLPASLDSLTEEQVDALRKDMTAVNHQFYRLFSEVTSTGLILDDAGKVNWLTAATLNLFKENTEVPNHWLACTFKSERTGELLFS